MEWELYLEEKLPKGWRKQIPGHCEADGRSGNGKRSPEYISWFGTLQKIYTSAGRKDPRHECYLNKLVCKRWVIGDGTKCGFLCFLEDMGPRPEGMTIDRINSEGHYTPDNCRWADSKTQASNKRKRAA